MVIYSGFTQLENGGSFHSFLYVYQRVPLGGLVGGVPAASGNVVMDPKIRCLRYFYDLWYVIQMACSYDIYIYIYIYYIYTYVAICIHMIYIYYYMYIYYYIYSTYRYSMYKKRSPANLHPPTCAREPRPLLLQPLGLGVVEVPQLAQANATVTSIATPVKHGETQGFPGRNMSSAKKNVFYNGM